ncbi:TIGR02206 family membrane protein [Bacillus bombysepticus]|uniref:TMEM164-related integral membrane acyltransferase n=1 Tax=Bacillus bombysepticus TaxID=658666 RepID=UPI00301B60C7
MTTYQLFAFTILIFVGVVFYTKKFTNEQNKAIRIGMAIFLLGCESLYQIFTFLSGNYDVTFDLPLHLCSVMVILAGLALLFNWEKVLHVLVLPLVGGPILALLMPFTPDNSPLIRDIYYFGYHICLISVAMFMVWVNRIQLSKTMIIKSGIFTLILGLVSLWYNDLTGGNYVFTVEPIAFNSFFENHLILYKVTLEVFILADMTIVYGLFALSLKLSPISFKVKLPQYSKKTTV